MSYIPGLNQLRDNARAIQEKPAKVLLPTFNVTIEVHRGSKLARMIRASNLVPLTGRNVIRDLLLDGGLAPSVIAIGTDGTATVDSTPGMQGEVFRSKIDRRYSSASKAFFQMYLTPSDSNGVWLREAGLLAGSTYDQNGKPIVGSLADLFARVTHSAIFKDSSVSITYTWEIPIASG